MYDMKALYQAKSVADAVALRLAHPEAQIIAGGSDVLVQMREGKRAGVELISIYGLDELRGVTLEEDGIARFPDAPTLRGVKHLEELAAAKAAGYEAAVCFIVQMEGMRYLEPNDVTHPQFGDALRRAAEAGVEVLAMECAVTPEELRVMRPIPVRL